MIRVEVTDEILPGKGKSPSKQVCYAHTFTREGKQKPHPDKFYYALWDGVQPLEPSPNYTLAPASVFVDGKYQELSLAPKLVKIPSGRGGA